MFPTVLEARERARTQTRPTTVKQAVGGKCVQVKGERVGEGVWERRQGLGFGEGGIEEKGWGGGLGKGRGRALWEGIGEGFWRRRLCEG